MWTKIARIILKNRITLLISIGLITVFMLFQIPKVELDYHFANMLSEKHPTYLDNIKFKEIFGEGNNAIISGFVDNSFFELEKFQNFQKLCKDLKKKEEIQGVISVSEVLNIRQTTVIDDKGRRREFETYPVFPDDISSQEELDSLKKVFYSLPFYYDYIYNQDENVYLLIVLVPAEIIDSEKRIPTVKGIEELILNYAETNNVKVHISGMPYIRTNMMSLIREEINLFIALAIIICIIILYLFFRSFKVVGISLFVVGIGVIWAVGLMGLLSYKITILSGMIPPLLIVIGVPNTIFLLNKYHFETKNHGNKILALQRSIRKIGNAIFLTNITTAVGFATFIITNSRFLIEFGIIASSGILFVFLIALIAIPSVFSFIKAPSRKYTKHLDYKFVNKFVGLLLIIVLKYRYRVFALVVIILSLAFYGITKIERTGYLLDDVKQEDPIYKDLKFFERYFKGTKPLEIIIKSNDSLNIYDKINQIERLNELQLSLSKYSELSRSISIADGIKFLYQAYSRGNIENYSLPPNPRIYETILQRLPNNLNNELLTSYIDSTYTTTRISLNIADIGTSKMQEILPKIQSDIDNIFPPDKYQTIITGVSIMYFVGSQSLINNLFISLSLAIFVISIILFLMFRTGKMVLISLVPNIIPMLVTAALMGYFNIPLKPSTILVFSIAFGISVDNTIHYLAKYRQELRLNAWNIGISAKLALKETSVSMMYTSVVLFFGFAIFIASDFGGTVALGSLVSIALFVAMFSNLVILPSLLLFFEKYFTKKQFKEPHIKIYEDEEDEINDIKK